MTWTETHRRMDALTEVEAALAAEPDRMPWRPEYGELFGTREGLADALRYRWRLRLQAHLDPDLDTGVLDEAMARLGREMPRLIAADLLPGVPPTSTRSRRPPRRWPRWLSPGEPGIAGRVCPITG